MAGARQGAGEARLPGPLSFPVPRQGRSKAASGRTIHLKSFQILDDSQAFLFGELVAEGVSAIAAARLRRVVDLAPFEGGRLRVGTVLRYVDLPAALDGIVVLLARPVRASVDPGPRLRVQDVVHRRHRAVVEV